MRNSIVALVGFLVGAGVIAAVAMAVPQAGSNTVTPMRPPTPMPMQGAMGSAMNGSASPATRKLVIQHVQRGCHVWSNGTKTAVAMRVTLKPGQRLTVLDQDVDAHQLLQFAGPAHISLGGPMMMNKSFTLSFPKKGVYRLGTKTVEMPGGMEVKTIGPDNNLRLVVTVA